MCMICERYGLHALGQDFNGFADAVLSPAPRQDVPVQAILSTSNAQISQELVSRDGWFDLYLHAPAGPILVQGGAFGEQVIQSVGISQLDQAWFQSMVARLDDIIDLDFSFTLDSSQADVALYYDTEINLGDNCQS